MMTFLKGAFSILFGLSFCLPLTLKLFLPSLSFIFPWLIVWLLKFNYDSRFLFMILPPMVILGVWSIAECFKKVLGEIVRKEVVALVMGGFLVLPHLGCAIVKNRDLFFGPSLSDDDKRLGKMRHFYPLVLYFKDLQSKGEKDIWRREVKPEDCQNFNGALWLIWQLPNQ